MQQVLLYLFNHSTATVILAWLCLGAVEDGAWRLVLLVGGCVLFLDSEVFSAVCRPVNSVLLKRTF